MKISDIMTQHVQTIHPGASVFEAAQKMKHAEVGVLPVLEDGQLVGIITDRDVVTRGIGMGADLEQLIVSNIMSLPVVTIGADVPVEAGDTLMREKNVRKLIVVDEAGGIVGILTSRDMAATEPREFTGELESEEVLEEILEVGEERKKVA